jgi:hypothetical protein
MKTLNPLKQIKLTWFVLPIQHPKPHLTKMQAQFNSNKMREICNMREAEMQALFCEDVGWRIKHKGDTSSVVQVLLCNKKPTLPQ